MTTVKDGLYQYGGMPVTGGVPPFVSRDSKTFFVDPVYGADGNPGTSPSLPLQTLYRAHKLMTAGNNDVAYLISDGSTTSTARLSAALAAAADSTLTTGKLIWSKNACHIIGVCAPGANPRARIAPVTTLTQATFLSADMVSVTASGCYFANISAFNGFATGGTAQRCWVDTGGRNVYHNVHFIGKGDVESAADAGSRSLVISGSTGEHAFYGCTIGNTTIKNLNGASVELEFAGGSPRNLFKNCVLESAAGGTTASWVTVGTDGIDRYVLFDNCFFFNPVLPADAVAASIMANGIVMPASPGGLVMVQGGMYYGAARLSAASGFVFVNAATAVKDGLLAVASAT